MAEDGGVIYGRANLPSSGIWILLHITDMLLEMSLVHILLVY